MVICMFKLLGGFVVFFGLAASVQAQWPGGSLGSGVQMAPNGGIHAFAHGQGNHVFVQSVAGPYSGQALGTSFDPSGVATTQSGINVFPNGPVAYSQTVRTPYVGPSGVYRGHLKGYGPAPYQGSVNSGVQWNGPMMQGGASAGGQAGPFGIVTHGSESFTIPGPAYTPMSPPPGY